jgi:hypothetical protein
LKPEETQSNDVSPEGGDNFLLTVLLKHDESKNLEQIQAQLEQIRSWEHFPLLGLSIRKIHSPVASWSRDPRPILS